MKKNFKSSIFDFQKGFTSGSEQQRELIRSCCERTRSKAAGFTLIETLVALSIMVVVVTAAYSAAQTAISSSIYAKNQIIAFYLAQEGVEQIRNIRDENGLAGVNWLTGISANSSDPCYFGNACRVEPAVSAVPVRCGAPGSCPKLNQNATTGFFGYSGSWPTTVFKREIVLTQISANEVAILVTVDWSKGLITRQFKVKENILNWQ